MKRILVTGAGGAAAYNFIKSLKNNPAREEFFVVGTDLSPYFLELSNADKKYRIAGVGEPEYLDDINRILEKEKIDMLHCQPDIEVSFASSNRDKLNVRTFLPDPATVDICHDKSRLNTLLKEKGVAVPEAYRVSSENDLKEAVDAILKNNEKAWVRAIRGAGSKAALPVKCFKQALAWINWWQDMKGLAFDDFMVSEFLPGKEFAWQSVWQNGELKVSAARERLEYLFGNLTPSGQSSSPSVAVSVHNDELNELAYRAVKAIDKKANGIFCADMKTDRQGEIKITEINPGRFFTTSYFFSKAGSNMPYAYVKMGLGEGGELRLKKYNSVPAGNFWVRNVDMGFKMIKGKKQ